MSKLIEKAISLYFQGYSAKDAIKKVKEEKNKSLHGEKNYKQGYYENIGGKISNQYSEIDIIVSKE